jgi:MFS family permease
LASAGFARREEMAQQIEKPNRGQMLLFGGLVFAFFITFFFRISASVVLPILAVEWQMNAAVTSFISSLYFYAYAVMQPISGSLSDKFGPSRVVSGGLLVGCVGALVFATANGPGMLAIGRLLTGFGLAPMLSGALVYQGATFDLRKYSFYSGIVFFIGNLGAVASVSPLGTAIDKWGRGNVFMALAVLTAGLASMIFLGRRNDKIALAGKGKKLGLAEIPGKLRTAWVSIRGSKQLMGAALIWSLTLGPLMALQGLWAVAWCDKVYPGNLPQARLWATFIGIGVMSGNIIAAVIRTSVRGRRIVIAYSATVYGIAWLTLVIGMQMGMPYRFTIAMAFIIGAGSGIFHALITAVIYELSPKGTGGSAFGLINLMAFSLVVASQSFTGLVINRVSKGIVYTPYSFTVAFAFMAVLALSAVAAIPALLHKD